MNHILWMTLLELFLWEIIIIIVKNYIHIISINQIQTLVVVFQYVSMIEGKNLLRVFLEEGGREGSLCNVKGGGHRNTIKYWPVMVCYDLKKKRPAMEIPLHLKLTTPGYHFARVFFVVFVVMDDLMFFPLWCKNYCTFIFFLSFYEQYCKNPQ